MLVTQGLSAGNFTFNVSLQTSGLSLTTPSYLDFQFSQGDPNEIGNNSAAVSFSSIFPDFVLNDGLVPGPGEQIISFNPGNPISFRVQLTGNATSASTPDLLAIYVLDSSYNAINTTDPAGVGTLVSFTEPTDPNQDISVGVYDTFNSDFGTSVTSVVTAAPEPSNVLLSACALSIPAFRLISRKLRNLRASQAPVLN